MATIESVRELALRLPRSYEVLVRDRVKFRVGRLVYLAFSRAIDDTEMRELVVDAWTMVVPKRVAAAYVRGE